MTEKVRTPNSEQVLAINHSGGVLLSAGAGSGKTFVLVEHIVYLLKNFRESLGPADLIEVEVKKYLNSIVMMTFTKKASGEMAARLHKRIELECSLDKSDFLFWEAVSRSLSHLYVGTIHGFCYKLIAGNFFPELSSHFDIIDSDSQKTKIEELFDGWYLESKKDRNDFLNQVILSQRKQVLNSVFEIFSSPDLRNLWSSAAKDDLFKIDLSQTMAEIFESEDWGHAISGRFDLTAYEAHSEKAWCKNILGFIKTVKGRDDWDSVLFWKDLLAFFETVSRWTKSPKKDKSFEIDEYVDSIKELKTFCKENAEGIIAFIEQRELFESWLENFYELFKYIDDRYEKLGGFTFSDLEYYVLKGLSGGPWAIEKISEHYKYFIVDEFQDTSEVQYEILKKLVNHNFGRLFCVGDVKQAIYGFRGGDLGVFRACGEEVPLKLELTKNYRSTNKVIHLNNTLFDHLFKVGINFSGFEKDPVVVQYQEYPGDDLESGDITKISININSEKALTSREMDAIEADALFEAILKKSKQEGTIGILYKSLGASSHLIPQMAAAGMSFTAQVKVPLKEGPLWGLFSTLLEGYLDPNDDCSLEEVTFVVYGILSWLGPTQKIDDVKKEINTFFSNIPLLGVVASFEVLLYSFNICDADFEKNFAQILHLNELAGEDPEHLYHLMYEFGPDKISVEFRYGESPDKIFLMTAHGSKGLEFDHIFIGGVHSNGRKMNDSPMLGKTPGSLKWKVNIEQKDYYKSPVYLLEERRLKKKDFAESKRLFYVACTRAQESLTYVDLSRDSVGIKYTDDSWINGFRHYELEAKDNSFTAGHISNRTVDVDFKGREALDDIHPPLFQKDNLGVFVKHETETTLGLLAEVSVTKLATLAQCPRKFYLSNICKLDSDDLERLGLASENAMFDQKANKELQEDERPIVQNSAERGTFIHDAISRAVKGNMVCPLDVEKKEKEVVQYALDLLKKKNTYSLLSEIAVKFSLFGQMISGTPDLVLLPQDKTSIPEIWDFKTGKQKVESELAYWFQLYCYGIQTCLAEGLSADDKILLALVYVDEKKIVEKNFSKYELENLLFEQWKKLGNFNQVNLDYCSSCSFGSLCQISS